MRERHVIAGEDRNGEVEKDEHANEVSVQDATVE